MPEPKTTPDREHHKRFRCDRYAKMIQRQKMLRECKPLEEGLTALARAKLLIADEKAVRSEWSNGSPSNAYNGRGRSPSVPAVAKTDLPSSDSDPSKTLNPSSSLTSISYTSNTFFPTSALRTSSLDISSQSQRDRLPSAASLSLSSPKPHTLLHKADALPPDVDNIITENRASNGNGFSELSFNSLPSSTFFLPKGATSTPIGSPQEPLPVTPTKPLNLPTTLFTSNNALPSTKPLSMGRAFGPSISSNSTDSGKFSFAGDKTPDSEAPKQHPIQMKSNGNTPTSSINGSVKTPVVESVPPPQTAPETTPATGTPTKAALPLAVRWVRHQRAIFQKASERLRAYIVDPTEADFRSCLRIEIGELIDHTLVKDVSTQHLAEFSNYIQTMLTGDAVVCKVRENKWFNFDRTNPLHMAFLYDVLCKRIFQMVSQDPSIMESATILHGILATHLPTFTVVFRTYMINTMFLVNLTNEDLVSVFTERTKKFPEPISIQSLPFERNLLKLFFTVEAASGTGANAKNLSELKGLRLIHEFSLACQRPQVPVMTGAVLLEILLTAGPALSRNGSPYQRDAANSLIPRLRALPSESVEESITKIANNLLADIRVPLTQMHAVMRQKIIDKLASIGLEPLQVT